jgi:excisionase family DNA binding protein
VTLDDARRLARQLPPTISVEEAGRLLGLSRSSAYEAAQRGELPTLAFGRRRVAVTARVLAMLGIDSADTTE